jgi:beta-lactamase regulating signal transducer with metallopeptidase domain
MTFLERLHDIGFASAAGLGGELLLKATAVLAAALVLDFLLHRRLPLACSASWNGALVLLALLPVACLALPAKRVASSNSVAANVASATELSPGATPSKSQPDNRRSGILPLRQSGETPLLQPSARSADAMTDVAFDDATEDPTAEPALNEHVPVGQDRQKAHTHVAAASSAPAPAPSSRWATILAWAAAAQPWLVPGLVVVYLTGAAMLALRLLASLLAVSRLRRRSQAVTADDWLEQLAAWRKRCGLRRAVELRHGGEVTVPIVIGVRRPAIIVPSDLLESASGAKRDAILAHELAHIVRGDCGWQLLERVIGALLWFHPLFWFAGRRIGLLRERICDGFAVHHLGRRNEYVETLLEMATRLTSRRGLSLGLAVLRTSQLGARLASVQNSKGLARCQVRPAARWAILLLTAAAAVWAGRAAVALEPVPQVAGLPSDAQALLAGYEQKSARLQAEVDRQVAAERDSLIKSLQALQDDYTKQAKLDEAVAIRNQLRLIRSPKTAVAGQPSGPPGGVGMGPSGGMPGMGGPPGMASGYPGTPGAPSAMPGYYRPLGPPTPLLNRQLGAPSAMPGYYPGEPSAVPPQPTHVGPPGSFGPSPIPPPTALPTPTLTVPMDAAVYDVSFYPLSMIPFRKSMGKVLLVEVTGAMSGELWGDSEVCTDDSSLAAAAVQFGVLRPGEWGMIKVTIGPGKRRYTGFSAHGVTSLPWDNTGTVYASLKIEAAPAGAYQACHENSGAAAGGVGAGIINRSNVTLANFVGSTFLFKTTRQVNTSLWGTDEYTHDSSLGAAAVHAGALAAGQTGYVFMNVKKGIPFYRGSTRHGVTSSDWKNAGDYVTLTFQSPSAAAREAEIGPALIDYSHRAAINISPESAASSELFRQLVGKSLYFNVTGSTDGNIWGSNPYTDDSSLAAAAMHSGILQPGEEGVVKVQVEPALDNYPGSTQHGVTSLQWNSGGGYVALRLSRVTVGQAIRFRAAARSGGPKRTRADDDINIKYAEESAKMAKRDLDFSVEANRRVPGSVPQVKIDELELKVIETDLAIDKVKQDRATAQAEAGVAAAALVRPRVLADPGTLANYPPVGQSVYFRITGGSDGSIWGTDVYTNESALATAAVHAGALRAGEAGIVKVTMLPALPQYHGSTNNGVTSQPWENDGSYVSYQVERADGVRSRMPATRGGNTRPGGGPVERKLERKLPLTLPPSSPS